MRIFKKSPCNSGVVLLITLILITILMVVGGSILFNSLNQGTVTHANIDALKSEELAKGIMWKKVYDGTWSGVEPVEVIDGKKCTPTTAPGAGVQQSITVKCH